MDIASVERIFDDANRAYEAGNWSAAVAGYSALVDRDRATASVLFNLGNAHLRAGDLGRSIAAFRRSLERAPRDRDAQANLRFARRSAKDAIDPPRPSPVLTTLFFWHHRLGIYELQAVVVVASVLFWGVLTLRIFRRDSEALKWLAVVLLAALAATAGSLWVREGLASQVAVIVPQEVEVYTAPDDTSTVRFKLHAGTELRVEDERRGWIRIALPEGQQGWVESEWVELTGR